MPEDALTPATLGMSPDDVVAASLVALAEGETICLPNLEDATRIERYRIAEAGVRDGAGGPLASRYGR